LRERVREREREREKANMEGILDESGRD